ncbi:hypothetical protein HMI56_005186, partial [Coelomomyces lativittatus]
MIDDLQESREEEVRTPSITISEEEIRRTESQSTFLSFIDRINNSSRIRQEALREEIRNLPNLRTPNRIERAS